MAAKRKGAGSHVAGGGAILQVSRDEKQQKNPPVARFWELLACGGVKNAMLAVVDRQHRQPAFILEKRVLEELTMTGRTFIALALTMLLGGVCSAGEGNVNALDGEGFAPLHLAAIRGDCQAATHLLSCGANVNVQHGTFEGTPLQYAAARGHVDMVKLLIRHDAKIDAVDTHGRTPLMWAAWKGHHHLVDLLLTSGANVKLATDTGWTALHYAVRSQNLQTSLLLAQHGAPLDARNSLDKTPAEIGPEK
jgi:ankyrin repeat protein